MISLKNAIDDLFKNAGIQEDISKSNIVNLYNSIVKDSDISAMYFSKAYKFENNTLFIKVQSSIIASELSLVSDKLILKMNRLFKYNILNNIIFLIN